MRYACTANINTTNNGRMMLQSEYTFSFFVISPHYFSFPQHFIVILRYFRHRLLNVFLRFLWFRNCIPMWLRVNQNPLLCITKYEWYTCVFVCLCARHLPQLGDILAKRCLFHLCSQQFLLYCLAALQNLHILLRHPIEVDLFQFQQSRFLVQFHL